MELLIIGLLAWIFISASNESQMADTETTQPIPSIPGKVVPFINSSPVVPGVVYPPLNVPIPLGIVQNQNPTTLAEHTAPEPIFLGPPQGV